MPNDVKEVHAVNDIKCVALGEDVAEAEIVKAADKEAKTTDEKVIVLEKRVFYLTNALDNMFTMVKELRDDLNKDVDVKLANVIAKKRGENKIEVPEGTVLTGKTKGLSYFLHTKDNGFYVGITRYDSLSSAAEGVSGVRRSGWTFWKLPNGKTVKEVFKG